MYEFSAIGKVLKAYRKSGEMVIAVEAVYLDDLEKCQAVFLEIDGLPVPFFVEYIERGDDATAILKVEEINAPEEVRMFNGESIFLQTSDISAEALSSSVGANAMEGLVGFRIEDKNTGQQYTITEVEQYPQQLMATVLFNDKQVLVPLAEELILDIDPENQKIIMDLPAGLLL
jgi:16S rRNA processing protein RimM